MLRMGFLCVGGDVLGEGDQLVVHLRQFNL